MQRLEGVHPAVPHPPASTPGHPLLDTCPDALSTSGQRARTKNRVRGSLSELIIHETRKVLALLLPLVRASCLHISQTLRPAPQKTGKRVSPQVKWPDLGSAGPSSSIPPSSLVPQKAEQMAELGTVRSLMGTGSRDHVKLHLPPSPRL